MTVLPKQKLRGIFSAVPTVKLVYFFGSRAQGNAGPMSDYDFAVYCDESDSRKIHKIRMNLIAKLTQALKTDLVDVVMLNTTEESELKYNIIKNGKVIYEIEPYRVLLEPKIMNEYFDFVYQLKKFGLTKA
jgi:predicted nucleotidyltransferase